MEHRLAEAVEQLQLLPEQVQRLLEGLSKNSVKVVDEAAKAGSVNLMRASK